MSAHNANRNLLCGILALQMDFVSREQLITATSVWVQDKSQQLDQILLGHGALGAETHALLIALVEKHLELHQGDAHRSLAAVNYIGSIHAELTQLGDDDVEASMAHFGRDTAQPEMETLTIGQSSVDGQRFTILRPHARGGLGQVSVAHDSELNREVALKEIQNRHADDPDSRARFVMEAEITGGLEHPGIVPVYGLGTYEDGRPFYAMRFIRGDSLRQAVDQFHAPDRGERDAGQRTLGLRRLLGRFIDVCNAIEYAHSRGVLHRDLKPGNIMLGKYGETLVVDWGLAKAVGRPEQHAADDERTLRPRSGSGSTPTRIGSAIGTPHYMPPEQAEGRLDKLGPPSDVYSLGATLYFLLTGKPPFGDAHAEIVLTRVQKGEFSPPKQVNPSIPAALESVCLKAMALRPDDRYASPSALADDVENWLADEAVSAHQEPIAVRTSRWMRKHPRTIAGTTATVSVAVVGLVVFLAVVSYKNGQLAMANVDLIAAHAAETAARQEADENYQTAQAEQGRADANFQKAQQVVDEFLTEVSDSKELLAGSPGTQRLRAQLLEKAKKYYEQFAAENERAGLEPEVAAASFRLGRVLSQIGETRHAITVHRKGLERWQRLVGQDSENRIWRAGLADSYLHLGNTLAVSGDFPAAIDMYGQAMELWTNLVENDPTEVAFRKGLAGSYLQMGSSFKSLGKNRSAIEQYRQALDIQKALIDLAPELPDHRFDSAKSYINLGLALRSDQQLQHSLEMLREGIETCRQLVQQEPDNQQFLHLQAAAYLNLGMTLQGTPERSAAIDMLKKAIEIEETLAQRNPAVSDYRFRLAVGYGAVASALGSRGDSAIEMYEAAVDSWRILTEMDPDAPEYRFGLGSHYNQLGLANASTNKIQPAIDAYGRAIDIQRELVDQHPDVPSFGAGLAKSYNQLGLVRKDMGDLEAAIETYEQSIAVWQALADRHSEDSSHHAGLGGSCVNLAKALRFHGDFRGSLSRLDDADTHLNQAIGLASSNPAAKRFQRNARTERIQTLNDYAWSLATSSESSKRDGTLALEHATQANNMTEWGDYGCLDTLAAAYGENGDFDDAVKWQEKAIELAPDSARPELEQRLELYRQSRPYRQPSMSK